MQKWEYCAIASNAGSVDYDIRWSLTQFTLNEPREVKTELRLEELPQVIAKLGEEGWEMVGCGNQGEWWHVLYFKREL